MADVVNSLTSTDGRFRIDVVRRPTGGYQLAFSRYIEEHVPEYGLVYEGWVRVAGRVTLTDTLERGLELAAEEMVLHEGEQGGSCPGEPAV